MFYKGFIVEIGRTTWRSSQRVTLQILQEKIREQTNIGFFAFLIYFSGLFSGKSP